MLPPSSVIPADSSRPRRKKLRSVGAAASIIATVMLVAAGIAVWGRSDGRAADTSPSNERSEPGSGSDESAGGGSERADDSDALVGRCGQSDFLTIPGTEISIDPVSPEQERSIGAETRSVVLEQYRVSGDEDTQAMLDRLLDELRPPGTDIDYVVTLLDSSEVNAFAIPGGDLFFTSAITSLMTEDELAFVMGHEVGHVACRHLAQQFEREALVIAGLDALLGTEIDTGRLYAEAAALILTDVADLRFSREDELESDLAALDLLAAAGRPLSAGPSALRALLEMEDDLEPTAVDIFFSTHPPTSERIDRLEDEIAQR